MFRRLGAFFLDILEVIVFAVAIFLFIYLLVLQPHKIKGASMHPNFPDGEYLLTDKVTYRFGEPKRGDVIVFKAPTANGDEFIKRIIGLPGEKVSVKNGKIYINEKTLEEKYLDASLITSAGYFLQEDQSVTVPEGEYFVLGDNRPVSSDSRRWGVVPRKDIIGKVYLRAWPITAMAKIEVPAYTF